MTRFIVVEQDGDPANDLIYPVNTPREISEAREALREAGYGPAVIWQTPATKEQLLKSFGSSDSRATSERLYP